MTSDMITGFVFLVAFIALELLSALVGGGAWGNDVLVAAPALLAACLLGLPRVYWPVIAGLAGLASLGIELATGSAPGPAGAAAAALLVQGVIGAGAVIWAETRLAEAPQRWLGNLIGACAIAPAVAAGLSAALASGSGAAATTFAGEFPARALGMAALLPLFRYLLGSDRAWTYRPLLAAERASALLYAALAAALEVMALHQTWPAVHFLATVAAIAAAWRGGRMGIVMATAALAAAAWLGGVFGPVRADVALVQLHLALTVLLTQAVGFLRDGRHVLNERLRASERALADTRSALRSAEGLYRLLGEASRDVVLKTDLDGRVVYASPAVATIADNQAGPPLGRKVAELVDPTQAAMFEKRFATAMAERRDVSFEHLVFHHGGIEQWFDARIHCQRDDLGAAQGGVVILRGLNERRALEDELVAATLRDPLTGLTNRATFTRMLSQHIEAGGSGCLAKFDLDHFRTLNQEHGNQAGDQILVSFANLLRSLLREGDVIARVGGERFAVMLPNATADEAERVCSRIVSEMTDIGSGAVSITASAGVSRIAATLDETMKNADRAVVVAKAKGRNRVEMDEQRGVFPR